jgi:hypothetical protein
MSGGSGRESAKRSRFPVSNPSDAKDQGWRRIMPLPQYMVWITNLLICYIWLNWSGVGSVELTAGLLANADVLVALSLYTLLM